MTVEMKFDLTAFKAFATEAPKQFEYCVKDIQDRAAAKMRKEFIRTIDTKKFEELQETQEYQSKYDKPLQMLKSMVRYRTKKSKGNIVSDIGVFPGKAGNSKINNATFKSRYGVTAARFAKIMTYGGRLRIDTTRGRYQSGHKRMVKQGFRVRKSLKTIRFPKRDWYTTTSWRRKYKIIPYFQKHLDVRVAKTMRQLSAKMNRRSILR